MSEVKHTRGAMIAAERIWTIVDVNHGNVDSLDYAEVVDNAITEAATTNQAELARLREAMGRIERWFGEFPTVLDRNGQTTTYGVAYGSNGERDYMRKIAREALGLTPCNECGQLAQLREWNPDNYGHTEAVCFMLCPDCYSERTN